MKKLLGFLFLSCLGFLTVNAQEIVAPVDTANGAKISFDKETHDYGTIEQNANGVCEFTYTNTGKEALTISNAKGSCGCTVPSYSREPLAPGESAVMKVKYDTKRIGPFTKYVTVSSNAVNAASKRIKITGKVNAPAVTTPATPTSTQKVATPTKTTAPVKAVGTAVEKTVEKTDTKVDDKAVKAAKTVVAPAAPKN